MVLTTLAMIMYEVKENTYDLFVSLLGLGGVMGLHIHIHWLIWIGVMSKVF